MVASKILSRVWVIIRGIWIDNWIYWSFKDHKLQVTIALSLIHAIYNSLHHALILLILLYFHRLSPGNGFQRRSFLSFRVHVLTGRWLSHNSFLVWRPSHINHLLLLLAVPRLSRNRSCCSLYSLGTDHTENTASYISSVASRGYR
jgi:hypothetical protein